MARNGTQTRERLLEAAGRQFAERGFRGSTVAGICRKAGANIAAVNYYFGGKEALYQEAWRYAHLRMVKAFPPDGGVAADAPPEQRLRGRIRAMLQRVVSDDGLEFRIMGLEMAQPTGLLARVIQDTLRPLREAMGGIVGELLGGQADERAKRLCVAAVIGPCMHLMHRQRMAAHEGAGLRLEADRLDETVEQLTAFCLAGIGEIRRRLWRGGAGGGEAVPAAAARRGEP